MTPKRGVIPVRPQRGSGLAEALDAAVREEFLGQHVLLRCISSSDHTDLSKAELVDQIVATGTDKYDRHRKGVAHGYYERWTIDFFATEVEVDDATAVFTEVLRDFEEGAVEDRGHSVSVDIVLVYDAAACRMVEGIYEGQATSDAFCFNDPSRKPDSLVAVLVVAQSGASDSSLRPALDR